METTANWTPSPTLQVARIDRQDGGTCLAVTGDIDMTTGGSFKQAVLQVLAEPGLRTLRLDVAGLDFIDSNGVAVLLITHRTAHERGISFAIINATVRTSSVLELLGVYDLLTADHLVAGRPPDDE